MLGVLLFSLFFVHREMENLMLSDNQDVQWTDSLITLLREKDANTIYMLRVLSETSDSMVSTREIESIMLPGRIRSLPTGGCSAVSLRIATRWLPTQEERFLPSFGRGVRSA